MKRFLSLVAVVALCFSLCVPALAADAEIPPVPELSSEMRSLISEHNLKVFMSYKISGSYFTCFLLQSDNDFFVRNINGRYDYVANVDHPPITYAWYEYNLDNGYWHCYNSFPSSNSICCVGLGVTSVVVEEATTVTMYNEDGSVFFSRLLHLWRNNFRHRRGS